MDIIFIFNNLFLHVLQQAYVAFLVTTIWSYWQKWMFEIYTCLSKVTLKPWKPSEIYYSKWSSLPWPDSPTESISPLLLPLRLITLLTGLGFAVFWKWHCMRHSLFPGNKSFHSLERTEVGPTHTLFIFSVLVLVLWCNAWVGLQSTYQVARRSSCSSPVTSGYLWGLSFFDAFINWMKCSFVLLFGREPNK